MNLRELLRSSRTEIWRQPADELGARHLCGPGAADEDDPDVEL